MIAELAWLMTTNGIILNLRIKRLPLGLAGLKEKINNYPGRIRYFEIEYSSRKIVIIAPATLSYISYLPQNSFFFYLSDTSTRLQGH